ncbi:MAG: hypothetical protein Q7J25_03640 [Vicinamibacterales bacterium]|nr:hypothetical protein [Vicinamibacterales bacterium]
MGLSGVSGPFTGAYQSWNIYVGDVPSATNSHRAWAYTVATGMNLTIYNIQAWCKQGGISATMDLFDDGASALTAPIGLATNTSGVGALATPLGVPVLAGSTITATLFNGAGALVEDVLMTVLWAPTGNTHPSSVRSAFE